MNSKLFSRTASYNNNCKKLCSVIGVIPQKDATYEMTWNAFEGTRLIAMNHFASKDYKGWDNVPLSQTIKSQMVALFDLFAYNIPSQLDVSGIDKFLLTNECEFPVSFLSDITERIRKPTVDEFGKFWPVFIQRSFTTDDMKLIPQIVENIVDTKYFPSNYFSDMEIQASFRKFPVYFILMDTMVKLINVKYFTQKDISSLCKGHWEYPNFSIRIDAGVIPLLNIDLITKYYGTDSVFKNVLLYYKYLFSNFVDSCGVFDENIIRNILLTTVRME